MNKLYEAGRRTAIFYWVLTLTYMGIIFYFSSLPGHLLFALKGGDKIVHAAIYSVLAYLVYLSFRRSGMTKRVFLISFAIAVVYGITDELHQFYVPGRVASYGDVLADVAGGFSGCCLGYFVTR